MATEKKNVISQTPDRTLLKVPSLFGFIVREIVLAVPYLIKAVKCSWKIIGVPSTAANSFYPENSGDPSQYYVTTKTDAIAEWQVEGGQNVANEDFYENLWDENPLTGWMGLAAKGAYGVMVPDSQAIITATFREQILFVEFGLKTHKSSITGARAQGDYQAHR